VVAPLENCKMLLPFLVTMSKGKEVALGFVMPMICTFRKFEGPATN